MGCFSYICPKCGKGIKSSSFDGERCIMFLLVKGKIVERMEGRYNSYGLVFKDKYSKHELLVPSVGKPDEHHENQRCEYEIWEYDDWSNIVDLMFNGDESNGIAAYHEECYDGEIPTEQSSGDPNQGWGDD